jgi:NTP pyrophosphatase (non-canonical NTP hydrolase)
MTMFNPSPGAAPSPARKKLIEDILWLESFYTYANTEQPSLANSEEWQTVKEAALAAPSKIDTPAGEATNHELAALLRKWCKPYPSGECCMCQSPPEEYCDEECKVPALMLMANRLEQAALAASPVSHVQAETREELLDQLGPVAPVAEELMRRMAVSPADPAPVAWCAFAHANAGQTCRELRPGDSASWCHGCDPAIQREQYLAINKCPNHGFYSITVEDDDTGTRVTPSKCCGRWDTVKRWKVSQCDLASLLAAQSQPAPVASPSVREQLTFEAFSAANLERCESPEGFAHDLHAWSASDWMTALVGEVGEAANIIKKLNRYRDGARGNNESEDALRVKLRKELGDVFVYLDLICISQGFTVRDAAVEVFNDKSRQIGYPVLLAAQPLPGGVKPPVQDEQEKHDTRVDSLSFANSPLATTAGSNEVPPSPAHTRLMVPPINGEFVNAKAAHWTMVSVYSREMDLIGRRDFAVHVETEEPRNEAQERVVRRGNRYYPTTVTIDVGDADVWMHPAEARELAAYLIEAADVADACDLPDGDKCGHWAPCDCEQAVAKDSAGSLLDSHPNDGRVENKNDSLDQARADAYSQGGTDLARGVKPAAATERKEPTP